MITAQLIKSTLTAFLLHLVDRYMDSCLLSAAQLWIPDFYADCLLYKGFITVELLTISFLAYISAISRLAGSTKASLTLLPCLAEV
jgi:hypothetical protein